MPLRPMHLHVERWTARPSWTALSIPDRIAYLDQMEPAFRSLRRKGARLVGAVVTMPDPPHRSGTQYVAVWKLPDGSQVQRLEEILAAVGWYDYFVPSGNHAPSRPPRSFFDLVPASASLDERDPASNLRRN